MTAHPTQSDFARPNTNQTSVERLMRPNVTEHFWGYEVRANEQPVDIAVVMRMLCGFLAGASFFASLGVWLLPAITFVSEVLPAKLMISLALMFVTMMLARIAARGTHVRLQIDTATGELREVVDNAFGGGIVLAHYGLDAVEAVDVVASQSNRAYGQIHVRIHGVGPVPAGDGALAALGPLRDRMASDCGLETAGQKREAIWSGPLAA